MSEVDLMDKQIYVDRLLESENLTDELQDADANWLLDWGISQLDAILQGVPDEDEADEKVTAWMRTLRKINRMLGARDGCSPEEMTNECLALAESAAQAFGREPSRDQAQCTAAAAQVVQGPPRQALEFLAHWGLQ